MRYPNKILVTGGAGFIGTNLIKRLVKEGHEVHSLDNYDSGTYDNEVEGCEYFTYDIQEIYKFETDYDVVFHLAALSRIQPSYDNPFETFRVNSEGTARVLEWARNTHTKVIYAGSSSQHHTPTQSPYATCKYLGEQLCKMYNQSFDMDVQIARFYNVYGPHEIVDGDWAAVIGIWRKQISQNSLITIVGDGEQRRDFTHVADIVDGLIRIMYTRERPTDAWELGSGVDYSINEVFDMFKETFPGIVKYPSPEQSGNYRRTIRTNDEALELLDWKPIDKLKIYIQSLAN
jgi:UDP-glucose 4-epimerase